MATKRSDKTLHTAKDEQHVQKLLKNNPDPDAVDDNGDTPLHAYVKRKDKRKFDCLMTFLIHSKCDLDKPNANDMTALHLAAELNDVQSAKALIAFGASFNALNRPNQTPLEIAHREHGYECEMVRILSGVGGKFGEAMLQTLYALPALSLWTKELREETENGKVMTETDYGEVKAYPDNSVHRKSNRVEDSLDEVPRKLEDVTLEEKPRAREVRFATPDTSVELGLTMTHVSALKVSGKYQRSPEDSLDSWGQINSAPISLESNGEKGASEKEPPGELSNGAVARFPLSQSKVHSTEKKQPDEDYVDGPTLCKLEQNTAAAMKKGMTLSTGDEGYAAWLQYREIQRAKKKAGLSSVGPSMIGIGLSGEPLPFKVKGGQRILCLDGGGIKGLVQIEILRQIQEATGKKITDLFEWIVGTSTGGILALAMVYAGLDLDELRQLYFEMKETVFKNPKFGYACDTPALEALLQKTFGTEMLMCDEQEPRVMVTAVDKSDTSLQLRFFSNCLNDKYTQVPVWKVARYTSAAPIFFTECDNYVDGGILANNPTDYALTEIQDYLETHMRGTQIACVVSVGCGIYPPKEIGNTDVLKVGKNIFKLAKFPEKLTNMLTLLTTALTKSEDVARNCSSRCEKQNIPYYRFNPELDEIISTIETDSEKLCDIIIKAKMLLESSQAQVDTLIQHFYYTAAHEHGAH